MAQPTELATFWTEEAKRLADRLSEAEDALVQAGKDETADTTDWTSAGAALDAARAAVDGARRALAAIPLPADATPLLKAMRDALVAFHVAERRQVDAACRAQVTRERLKQLRALRDELRERSKRATAEAKAQDDAAKQRTAMKAAARAQPLAALPALAQAALAASRAAAKTKVEGDFPSSASADSDFLTRVRARRALGGTALDEAVARAGDALAQETTFQEATGREAAKTDKLRRAFEATLAQLADFVAAPVPVVEAATALAALAGRVASPLTLAQSSALTDAPLKSAREAALAKLTARDKAEHDLADARRTYDNAFASARAADPDKTEAQLVAAGGPVATAHQAAAAAETALTQAALGAADGEILETWFAAVPDALWDQLEALDAADAVLEAAAAAQPGALATAVEAAEALLAANLDAAAREERKAELIAQRRAATATEASVARSFDARRRRIASRFVAPI